MCGIEADRMARLRRFITPPREAIVARQDHIEAGRAHDIARARLWHLHLD